MKTIPLIILTLIAGYNYGSNCKITRYLLSRNRGYGLYFKTAYYGIILLFVSITLYIILNYFTGFIGFLDNLICKYFGMLSMEKFENQQLIRILIIGFFTILLSYIYFPINLIIKSSQRLTELVFNNAIKNRDFEKLIWRALRNNSVLQVTMSNNKVYVGYVIRTIDPEAERTELRLLPILSGYRDETSTVIFKNMYKSVLDVLAAEPISNITSDEHLDDAGLGDFEIVLPYYEIRHSSMFDYEVYLETNNSFNKKINTRTAN